MLCMHWYMGLCVYCSWQGCGSIVLPRYVRRPAPRRSQSLLSAHQERRQVYYSWLKGSLTVVPRSTVLMTDKAGSSTQDSDTVAGGITIRKGLREADSQGGTQPCCKTPLGPLILISLNIGLQRELRKHGSWIMGVNMKVSSGVL